MIIIAGAGIGGLTLGCALARINCPFRLRERTADLRPVGAGIALSQNALSALAHIGLDASARAAGQELGQAAICDQHGQVLIGYRIRDIVPGATVAMARSALQRTLIDALGSRVETGQAVASYEHLPSGVRVTMSTGETLDGELLVGADGLHSAVRLAMRGDEPLRYSGYTSWRALVDGIDLTQPDRFTESWGAGQRFGIVPIGRGRVYWFAVADAPAGQRDEDDVREELTRRFAGWHAPIEQIIGGTPRDQIIRTDIFDRVPIARWTDRRVALIGDAAHPMTPNLGIGGCQAIEDAVVLADALRREHGIDAALARFEAQRIPRANSVAARSDRRRAGTRRCGADHARTRVDAFRGQRDGSMGVRSRRRGPGGRRAGRQLDPGADGREGRSAALAARGWLNLQYALAPGTSQLPLSGKDERRHPT